MSASNPLDLSSTMPAPADAVAVSAERGVRAWFDRVGIGASVLCAIHCMAAPFLLLLLPAAGSVWSHPVVHWVLAVLVVPLALWVLYNGYRKHGKKLTLVSAAVGAVLILAGLIAPVVHTQPIVEFAVPSFLGGAPGAADHAAGCTDTCCPSVTHDASSGSTMMAMPPGGLLTLVGSLFLVLAHSSNLLACRCFSRQRHGGAEAACGCPA